MAKTITISEQLYARLASLARPFVDKEAADVIGWLVEKEASAAILKPPEVATGATFNAAEIGRRLPRERGAVVALNGHIINADSVPDLCTQVMNFVHSNGYWDKVLELAPYKTSSKRYLLSKNPVHPNGNDFFVPIKFKGVYIEAHKNYKTSIDQLTRFLSKCGITLKYMGT